MSRKKPSSEFVSPSLSYFPIARAKEPSPEALQTEVGTRGQINAIENTYLWGRGDNLPLLILDAIAESPTTTSCLGTVEMFIRGGGFTDDGIGKMVVDKDGTTLDEFHAQLCANLTNLRGFAVNFQFDGASKITNSYAVGTEGIRLVAPPEGGKSVNTLKHNPYWGMAETYKPEYTFAYPVWNKATIKEDVKKYGTKFMGQMYLYGKPRAPYKHYPVPKFWSGKKWIYSDAKIATYVDELLGNGFFQSVLMQVIGDPNLMSKNPRLQKKVLQSDGVTYKMEPTHTVGEEFNMQMSANFSGVQKAGTAFVKWVTNKEQAVDLQEFPTNADFAFVEGVILNTMRSITVATQVPAVLANLPNSVSSLAGQDAIKNAIEFMQSATESDRITLENFYNTVLIPNLQTTTSARVKIKNYIPISTQVTVQKEIWEWMNDAEKADFVTTNVPSVKVIRTIAPLAPVAPTLPVDPNNPTPAPTEAPAINENLKNLKISDINRVMSIVGKYDKGQITIEQATQLLTGYGFSAEQITAWLTPTNGVLV